MNKRLDKIEVKGFKSIKEMHIDLGPLNVLIGANGAGKSNFVSLFQIVNHIIQRRLQDYVGRHGGPKSLLHYGPKKTKELFVKLSFGNNAYQFSLVPTVENTLIFSNEECHFHNPLKYPTPYIESIGSGHNETKLLDEAKKKPNGVADHVLDAIKSWQLYHFHDTSDSSAIKQFGEINDNSIFRADAANLAAFLFLLKENYNLHYKNIIDTIRLAAPFFDDFVLRPNPLKASLIQLEWREKGSDEYFNAHSLSDGTLRFICMATLLLQPELPSTILLDEPELGLHPYAISLLAEMLQSAASKTQVIISTQSVTLVNQFSPEHIIIVEREGKQSVFRHLKTGEMESWLEHYGLGDLWEKNVLGGRPTHE
jgi:predicted ATPase